MKKLNYLWRLFATGLCFATFSLGGLLIAGIVLPTVMLTSKSKQEKIQLSRKIIHKSFGFFTKMMSVVGVVELDIAEVEQTLRESRGQVVVANHPSLIDVVVLISIMPQADCIIKAELWNNRFFGRVLKAAGYIKNSGNIDELMAACKSSLDQGYSLIIFPEGTRTVPGHEITLQRGASNIALRCGVNLVSVLIRCKPTALTKNERWYNIPAEKICLSMRMGKVFDIDLFQQEDLSLSRRARYLTSHLKKHLIEGLNCYD